MIKKANRAPEAYEVMMAHTPIGRWGTPLEMAYSILYLVVSFHRLFRCERIICTLAVT